MLSLLFQLISFQQMFSLGECVTRRLPIEIQVDTTIFPNPTAMPPLQIDFFFRPEDLCLAAPPTQTHLIAPNPTKPPNREYYPLAPQSGYQLVADANIKTYGKSLECIATPPKIEPDLIEGCFVASPIPGMVEANHFLKSHYVFFGEQY